VCGDLTSVFKPYNGETLNVPGAINREDFVVRIHKAQFGPLPSIPAPLTANEIRQVNAGKSIGTRMPSQEKGARPSCPLPYELLVAGKVSDDKKSFQFTFEARKDVFKDRAAGAPFTVYAFGKEWATRSYAVAPGESVSDSWPLQNFDNGNYHFRVDGPNGYYREFKGNASDMALVDIGYELDESKALTGNVFVSVVNMSSKVANVEITDNAYGQTKVVKEVDKNGLLSVTLNLATSSRWYDFTVRISGTSVVFRFAGRVETGKEGITDPAIG
jgi:phospholipase C